MLFSDAAYVAFSGSSSGRGRAAQAAAGKQPHILISDPLEELRDSGSSLLKSKDAAGKSQPDMHLQIHSKNVSFLQCRVLIFVSVGNSLLFLRCRLSL